MAGCESTSHGNGVYFIENRPFNNGWSVSFALVSGGNGSDLVTVYALCAELLPPSQY